MTDIRTPQSQGAEQTPRLRSETLLARGPTPAAPVRGDLAPPSPPPGLAALGLAPADLHAHGAHPAVPARARQRAGVGAAAAGRRPAGVQQYYLASGARAVAEPARAVQRVRRALVRGDLPAAVPLVAAAWCRARPAGPVRPRAAAARAAQPGPAAALGRLTRCRCRRRGGRRGACCSAAAGSGWARAAGGDWVAAEKGHRREAGNLLFHLALLGVLVSIGLGGLFGYKGDRLLVGGSTFADTATDLDVFHPGRLVVGRRPGPVHRHAERVQRQLPHLRAARGQPANVPAPNISTPAVAGGRAGTYRICRSTTRWWWTLRVFLIGHGFAPVFKVTDGSGRVVFDQADAVPGRRDRHLHVRGRDQGAGRQAAAAWLHRRVPADRGDPVGGSLRVGVPGRAQPDRSAWSPTPATSAWAPSVPQSVYQLDTAGMHRSCATPRLLAPGQSVSCRAATERSPSPAAGSGSAWPSPMTPGQVPALVCGILGARRAAAVVLRPAPPGVRAGAPRRGRRIAGDGRRAGALRRQRRLRGRVRLAGGRARRRGRVGRPRAWRNKT